MSSGKMWTEIPTTAESQIKKKGILVLISKRFSKEESSKSLAFYFLYY